MSHLIGTAYLRKDGEAHIWSWAWNDDQPHGAQLAMAIPQENLRASRLVVSSFGCRCQYDDVPLGTTSRPRWIYYCIVSRENIGPVGFREEGSGKYDLVGGGLI